MAQSIFPGGTVDRRLAGPPAPAAHQATSLGSVEGNSPRRPVRCLGLGMPRCGADAVCPRVARRTPAEAQALGG